MKRKAISLFIVMLLIIGLLAGCQNNGETSASTTATTATSSKNTTTDNTTTGATSVEGVTAPGQFPIVTDDYTLKIAFCAGRGITDFDDNAFTNFAEERTGINLEFEFLATAWDSNAAVQKFELMVASKEELADIVDVSISAVSRHAMYEDGIILPLDDLFEQTKFYWDSMVADYVNERDLGYMTSLTRTYDGTMISYPLYYGDPSNDVVAHSALHIKDEWLELLDLNTPHTTDALYTVLTKFRDSDPNKNGKADEIPLLGGNAAVTIINSFIPYNDVLGVKDGKVYATVVHDEYREALRYLNKLVSENLYAPATFTMDDAQFKAIMNAEDSGNPAVVGMYGSAPTSTFTDMDRRMSYSPVWPISGPKGAHYSTYNPSAQKKSLYNTFITKYCEKPEVAARFLDSLCEEEFMLRARWGVPGTDYVMLDDGKFDCIYSGLGFEAKYVVVNNPYASENNLIWRNDIISLPPALMGGQAIITADNNKFTLSNGTSVELTPTTDYNIRMGRHAVERYKDVPEEIVGRISYTAEEDMELADIPANIKSYAEECRVRFILGELSLDSDWDNYVATLQSIGLDDYINITQTVYTRKTTAGQ